MGTNSIKIIHGNLSISDRRFEFDLKIEQITVGMGRLWLSENYFSCTTIDETWDLNFLL